MTRMESQSRLVVYGLEFQAAMRAAIAVASPKKPHDLVQVAVTSGNNISVCARDGVHNIMVETIVGAKSIDLGDEYDHAFEITRDAARELVALKVRKSEDDEDPLVGITVSGKAVTRTDETGLSLGIRMARVRRHSYRGENMHLGDIGNMMQAAQSDFSMVPTSPVELTVSQIKKIDAVAAALGGDLIVQALEPTDGLKSRALVHFDMGVVFAAIKDDSEGNEPGESHDEGSFKDQYVTRVHEALAVVSKPLGAV